jgi:hypothetical protein
MSISLLFITAMSKGVKLMDGDTAIHEPLLSNYSWAFAKKYILGHIHMCNACSSSTLRYHQFL